MEQIFTQLVKIRVKTQLLCCNLIPRKIFQKEKSAIQRVVIHSGKKYYISLDNPTEVTHKVNIDAEVDWVTGYLRGGYYHGELELSEEDYKTFKKDPLNFLENHIDLWVDWSFEINDCEIGELSQVYFTDQTN